MKKVEVKQITDLIINERNSIKINRQKLLQLNFNINVKGFEYWTYGLCIYEQNMKLLNFYHAIATKFEISEDNVERSMRLCSQRAIPYIRKKYHYLGRITTRTILELLTMEE